MSKFDLLYEQDFTSTDSITITHNLDRNVFNVRLIIYDSGDSSSERQYIDDIVLDTSDPLNKMYVSLTDTYTGKIQLIAEDTVTSPYYTVHDKLQSQIGIARFPIQLVMNGTMSNNDYVTYSNLISNPAIRFPTNSKLTEITWNNSNTSVDFDLEFSRFEADGTAYSGNPFYTYEVRNQDYGDIETGLDYDFLEGDYIEIVYKDQGTNCSDFVCILWCYKTE